MEIKSVTYRRLRSHPNKFGHDALEASAQVSNGETPEQALSALRAWVLARLSEVNSADETASKIEDLDDRARYAEQRLEKIQGELEAARKAVKVSERIQELCRAAGFRDELLTLFGEDSEVPF